MQKRERNWIEISSISDRCRRQVDANKIDGEPDAEYLRHTPIGDRSGDFWLPGWPNGYIRMVAVVDGEHVPNTTAVDCEKGYVEYLVLNPDGSPAYDRFYRTIKRRKSGRVVEFDPYYT